MITRILIHKDGDYFYQYDKKSVSTHRGMLSADDINNASDGAVILSNTHQPFSVLTPTFLDHYRRLERGPQIMLLKDLGVIAAETGMGRESVVGDAGTGSGAAAIYFSRVAKHVHTFDVESEHTAIGKRNADELGAHNITFHRHDVYESIPTPDGPYDVFVLDNPEPWKALPHYQAIKIGGWFVAYIPTILQAAEFANAVHGERHFEYRKTVELIERHWSIKDKRVRPSSDSVGHTGFLVYVRRIK